LPANNELPNTLDLRQSQQCC